MMKRHILYGVLLVLLGAITGSAVAHAETSPCEVTAAQDLDPVTGALTPGSFRQKLLFAMAEMCTDKKIIFKISKVTMNAPLGTAIFSGLKGLTIEPASDISQVEMVVKYDSAKNVMGCSGPSPYDNCFAYLPVKNVTIRNIKVTVDASSPTQPLRGLCIDKEEDAQAPLTTNQIVLEQNEFNGFGDGGVVLSPAVDGVKISKTTFHGSAEGIVVEEDLSVGLLPDTPLPPTMGGSNAAVFAKVDTKGHVTEYHVRGIFDASQVITAAELFESDGKAGTKYLQNCDLHSSNLIDGKWNIDCVLLPPLTLPFNYAITVTNDKAMTSMFATGTIPADLAKVPMVTPSTPQPAATPPKVDITDQNPPKVQDNLPTSANQNTSPPLSLSAGSPGTAGCSLIR